MLSQESQEQVRRVVELLRRGRSLLFVTGAGLSADSGLPTYRGIGGLYQEKMTDEGIPIEEALSGWMMERRPEVSWRYIAQIERACRGASFNRGHEVIAEMEGRFERVWVLTQNVDGFHRAAGSRNVIDIHGDVHGLCCTGCRYGRRVDDYSRLEIPPRCPECGAILRPDVVLFGEMLPYEKAQRLSAELARGFDVVFSVGTTSVFPYIAEPVLEAARLGVPSVEINPDETSVTPYVAIKIAARAAETLEAIWSGYRRVDRGT
ncbi:MAG: NAD-dependent protein deacylase [Phycisphaerae bacterium]|nr:NAD-dependent protein deacylase [Phycisphaerae bacterium]